MSRPKLKKKKEEEKFQISNLSYKQKYKNKFKPKVEERKKY